TLLNLTLNDFNGTDDGTIQVDGDKDGAADATDAILELQNATIDGGSLGRLNVDGQLLVTDTATNVIKNFTPGQFSNDGWLQVADTNAGTKLTLLNLTLNDFNGTDDGTIQVDGDNDGAADATDAILELQNATIDGGSLGRLNVDGQLLVTDTATNVIKNFTPGQFTNDGWL